MLQFGNYSSDGNISSPSPARAARTSSPGPSRRTFLGTAGLALAGAATLSVWAPGFTEAAPAPAAGPSVWRPPVLFRRQVRSARPGETFLITGSGFNVAAVARAVLAPAGDCEESPWRAPMTPAGRSIAVRVVAVRSTGIMLILPTSAPKGVYAIYVSAGDGRTFSAPFVVNSAQGWFADAASATAGERVTVYGENLRLDRTSPSVALAVGSGFRRCAVVDSDAYHLSFIVPPGLRGRHSLRVSNGHGGAVGLSAALSLNVTERPPVPRAVIEPVQDHGADPTGQADSTGALQAALDAAAASPHGARIRLPAGTFTISAKLMMMTRSGPIVLEGAGKEATIIRMSDDVEFTPDLPRGTPTDIYGVSAEDASGMIYLAPSDVPVTLQKLTFDTNQRRIVAVELDASHNVTIADVGIENIDYPQDVWLYVGTQGILGQNLRNLTVERCDFHCGNGCFLIAVVDVRVQDSLFRLFYPRVPSAPNNPQHQADDSGVKIWGANRVTVRRNRFERGSTEFYYARAVQTGGLKLPASVVGVADAAGNENAYYGQNVVVDAGEPASNCGEALVGDQFNSVASGRTLLSASGGSATTITAATATFALNSDKQDPLGASVLILSGTGVGQLRKVVANTTTTLTVDEPWDVVPVADSTFVVIALHQHELYIGNVVRRSPKYLGNYGPSALCIAANNDFDSAGSVTANPAGTDFSGISFVGIVTGDGPPVIDTCSYNQIVDNKIVGGVISLVYDDFSTVSATIPAAPLLLGNVVARNSAKGEAAAVRLGTPYGVPPSIFGTQNLVVNNAAGTGTSFNTIIDAPWDGTLYQGPAGALQDGGSNTVVVPVTY